MQLAEEESAQDQINQETTPELKIN